jgi:hypothetical protein
MLTEARVVLPGVQAVLGFQLISVISQSFEKLPSSSKLVHATSLGCMTVAVVLLIAPAAYHRIVFSGQVSEEVHRVGSWFVTCATVPLAFGLAGDVYVRPDRDHRFRENRGADRRHCPRIPRRSLADVSSRHQAATRLTADGAFRASPTAAYAALGTPARHREMFSLLATRARGGSQAPRRSPFNKSARLDLDYQHV